MAELAGAGKKKAKKGGKGRNCTTPERVALSEAYKQCTQYAGVGTSQQTPALWASILFAFLRRMPPKLTAAEMRGRWNNRPPTSGKTEFLRNIGPCCQRFAHFYHVASTRLTGDLNEDSVLRAARCLYTATSAYAAEQKDVDYEKVLKEQGKSPPVRRSRLVPENWPPWWKVLRAMDTWSGASANPEMERLFIDDVVDEDDSEEETESQSAPPAAGEDGPKRKGTRKREEYDALQSRPLGRQAAKPTQTVAKKEDAFESSLEMSNKAMLSVADSMANKAALAVAAYRLESRKVAIDFFSRQEKKDTPEGVEFRSMMLKLAVDLGRATAETAIAEHAEREGAGPGAPSSENASAPGDEQGASVARASAHAERASRPPTRGTRSMATKAAGVRNAIDALIVDLPVPVPPSGAAGVSRVSVPDARGRAESEPSDVSAEVDGDEGDDAVDRDAADFDNIELDHDGLDGDDSNERDVLVLSGQPDEDEDEEENEDEEEDCEEA